MATTVLIAAVCDQTLCICSTWSWFTEGNNRGLVDADGDAALDCVDSLSITWFTGAPLNVVHNNTLGVGSTWVGLALLHWFHARDGWRVALEPGQAVAHWPVSNHSAAGIGSTLVATTLLAILDATDEWVSSLSSRARADGVAVVQLADCSDATWGWHTWVGGLLDEAAAHVWIPVEAGLARADRVVVREAAVRVGAAELAAAHRQTLPAEPVAVLVLGAVRVDQAL